MKEFAIYALCAIVGYLIGNLQTSILLSKAAHKKDIRTLGSGNAGSTNMLRNYGIKAGLLTFLGDFLKAFGAVWLGRLFGDLFNMPMREYCGYMCGFFSIIGHNFPVFFGFKGGKGVASSIGVVWALGAWPIGVITTLCGIIGIVLTNMVSVGSMVGAVAFAVVVIVCNHAINIPICIMATVMAALLIIRHHENIKRIIKGTESKLIKKKAKQSESEKSIEK